MKTSELLKDIEQAFEEKLSGKTGWGRNEIKTAYQQAVNEVLMQITDQVVKDE